MGIIHYRVEPNPLTKPASYRLRFVPQMIAGYDEVAARVAQKNPGASAEQIKIYLKSAIEEIIDLLCNGAQITLEEAMTIRPSLRARLNTPTDPLPPIEEVVGVTISAGRRLVRAVQAGSELGRVNWEEKLPMILAAADANLGLNDVADPTGVLELNGSHLLFNRDDPDCGCVLAGTESGSTTQTQFGDITDTRILVVPHIPSQSNPWNNEYTVSITTQYSEHGSIRTGVYRHKLRSPLTVPGLSQPSPPETGILTDNAGTPYVGVNAGTLTANERLRIQVLQDQQDGRLFFNLIDLQDGGVEAEAVMVTQNGEYILPGFTGSAVSSLEITVNNYTALWEMIRDDYDGRLVDILDVEM